MVSFLDSWSSRDGIETVSLLAFINIFIEKSTTEVQKILIIL